MEGAKRQSKHMQINEATGRVLNQVEQLEILVAEIAPPKPKSLEEISTDRVGNLTLSEFLNGEPTRLNRAAERIEKLIAELREELF